MTGLVSFTTGISGSGRLDLLKEVANNTHRLKIIDVGSRMYKKSEELGIRIPEGKILDMDPLALDYLRAATFEDILRDIEKMRKKSEAIAISTHTCFRWKKHLTHAFNFYYLNKIDPDIYINIVDNVHYIYAKLQNNPAWKNRLTLKDLLVWRDEELFITRMLAEYRKKPFYLFSRREDPRMLEKILFDIEMAKNTNKKPAPKAYLSYPITHVKGSPKFFEEKEETKKRLKEAGIVIFDPIAVEDFEIVDLAYSAKSKGQNHIKIKVDGVEAVISVEEVYNALEDIKDQVVARDYQLITQSDMIIVYYPTKILSPGVLSEINFGFTHNKQVYAIFPHESVSPFFEYYTTKIFKDVDSLIEHLREENILQ